MPNIPTPIRAVLGLAATAVDEARKLPETLPQAVTTVPLMAVSTAMQASLKLQQHLATLAARGDEVLSQLRGSSAEPPSWATFDDASADVAAGLADDPQSGKAAFDLIDYDNTGFAEGSEDDAGRGRWDAVGVGGSETPAELSTAEPSGAAADLWPVAPPLKAGAKKTAAAKSGPAKAGKAAAKSGPAKAAPAKRAPGKAAPAVTAPAVDAPAVTTSAVTTPAKATPTKAGPAKAGPAKATAAKAGPAKSATKSAPAKSTPAKAAKRSGRKEPDHEPLEVAARKAKPSATPNPATMAAEILQAHVAAPHDE